MPPRGALPLMKEFSMSNSETLKQNRPLALVHNHTHICNGSYNFKLVEISMAINPNLRKTKFRNKSELKKEPQGH